MAKDADLADELIEPGSRPFNLPLILSVVVGSWVAWGVLVLCAATMQAPAWIQDRLGGEGLTSAGQFGDLFGGINALATALAFAMVWWTGHMQRIDLQLQRHELRLQRRELSETRAVFRLQIFESTFFQQIALFRQLSASFEPIGYEGTDPWGYSARYARRIMSGEFAMLGGMPSSEEFRAYADREYRERFYNQNEAQLGPYFRIMYHLFKLIDGQPDLEYDEKVKYANLARAQLGSDELDMLALNALSTLSDSFLPLIERYGLLKHVRAGEWSDGLRRAISPTAFMEAKDRSIFWALEPTPISTE